jgi:Api92-like protein with ferredoxin domain
VSSWYVTDPDALLPTDEQVRLFTPEEEAALADIGYTNWHDWSVEHWGTKWNASRVRVEDGAIERGSLEIMFETAWAAPFSILRKLASMFPGIRLEFTWTDEDEPHVTHTVVLRSGDHPHRSSR